MDTPPLTDTILSAYGTIFRALQRATIADWLDLDCSMAQLKALFVIAREEPAPIGRVAEVLQVGLPTASHLVDRLVQDGMVARANDPTDRRRTLASLTPQGTQLCARLRQGSAARLHSWLDQLDDEERAILARGLQAMARVADMDADAPAEATPADSQLTR
ncbi:MAG: MarR family transcriptional regulator [Chloroflexales bacterium]